MESMLGPRLVSVTEPLFECALDEIVDVEILVSLAVVVVDDVVPVVTNDGFDRPCIAGSIIFACDRGSCRLFSTSSLFAFSWSMMSDREALVRVVVADDSVMVLVVLLALVALELVTLLVRVVLAVRRCDGEKNMLGVTLTCLRVSFDRVICFGRGTMIMNKTAIEKVINE